MLLTDNETAIIIRIILAAALGLLIGLQREKRKVVDKSLGVAGLRTHALVCLASALITSLGILYFTQDPIRLAASIMTGIGFIGAGTIIASNGKIRGLTNAATIWVVASIGIAVGIGSYIPAVVAAIIVFIVLELKRFEKVD